jgi:hypothetical protein
MLFHKEIKPNMPVVKKLWETFSLLFILLFPFSSFVKGQNRTITFSIDRKAKVSLGIFRGNELIRTLLAGDELAKGKHKIVWDGRDENSRQTTDCNNCAWKLIEHEGLKAEYQVTIGSNLPKGNERWQIGLGSHSGAWTVATDNTGIYLGGLGENTPATIKMDISGSTLLWAGDSPAGYAGVASMAILNKHVYSLTQLCYVHLHSITEGNKRFQAVGFCKQGENGNFIGKCWDAWSPEFGKRPDQDQWLGAEHPMDLATFENSIRPQLAISYRDFNKIIFRDPETGRPLDSVQIASPKGITFTRNGDLLVISNKAVYSISAKDKKVIKLISEKNLVAPYRLDVNKISGDIVLIERAPCHQVKRFSAIGQLLKTYGKYGGRNLHGLYKPEEGFFECNDIATINNDFIVAESDFVAPRRVVRISSEGRVVKEWYTAGNWTPYASPDRNNPSVVWMTSPYNSNLMRILINYEKRTWKIHSVYNLRKIGAYPLLVQGFGGGGGLGAWKVREKAGQTYFLKDAGEQIEVLKLDTTTWTIKGVAVGNFGKMLVNNVDSSFLWVDKNNDGIPQPANEITWSKNGLWNWQRSQLRSDDDLNYYYLNTSDGNVYKVTADFDKNGRFINYNNGHLLKVQKSFSFPLQFLKPNKTIIQINPACHMFSFGRDNSIYCAIDWANKDYPGWSEVDTCFVLKYGYSESGYMLNWKIKSKPAGRYGSHTAFKRSRASLVWSSFRNNIGVAHDAVFISDYNGGFWMDAKFKSDSNYVYVWDKTGLWIDNAFDDVNLTGNRTVNDYFTSSENASGDLFDDKKNNIVYLFLGGENTVKIYRITGWKKLRRQEGML